MAMNPMGGIDQQITQRSAQLKNDPNALMQKYGQSKDILDLIAAQRAAEKVKKEKEIAALQMQQNPATIADQLEQELVAGEKEQMAPALSGMKNLRDRTTGVAGVLAQKQQQQQKRMQQQGQQQQRPPQQQQRPQGQPQGRPQGQPMMAGGGLLSQRAPNLERMYGGGIVAFQLGGEVEALIEEYRKNRYGAKDLSDEEILDQIEKGKPTEVAEYRKKVYGARNLSDAEIEQAIKESFSGRLRDADTPMPEPFSGDPMSIGLGMGSTTLEPLATGLPIENMESTRAVAPAEKVVAEEEEEGETVADEARAVGEEAGTAAADETELSTLEQVLKGAEQFGLTDDSAVPDAPLAQAKPVDDYLLNPAAQAARQGDRQREAFSANEASLNMGMPAGGLETLDRSNLAPTQGGSPLPGAPEMLRRAPEKELTYEEQLQALRQKRLDALTEDEEGLKDTRSNTRRLLDRLTEGAINASKRGPTYSTSAALGSFGTGISEAVRAEETERKEGLAGIRDRRSKLLESELKREQALAQIGQGQQGLDLKATEIANNLGINLKKVENDAQRLNMDTERYVNALAQSSKEFAITSAFKAMDLDAQAAYRRDTAALKATELDLKEKATKARTDASKQGLMVEIASAKAAAQDSAREAELSVLGTFKAQGFTGDELNTKVKEAVTAIRTDRDALIASLDAIASGTGIAMPAGDGAGGGGDSIVDQARKAVGS